MVADTVSDLLDHVVDFPWAVLEYQSWVDAEVRGSEASDDYLFAAAAARFIPDDADVLVRATGATVAGSRRGARVQTEAGTDLHLDRCDPRTVQRVLDAMDGQRPLAAVVAASGVPYPQVMAVLRGTFGHVVFAPDAIGVLEQEVSGTEITRFPGSPYEIERPYWRNMVAVRRALGSLDELEAALASDEQATRCLRRLHVLALMGEDLRTYYKPASRISSKGILPGTFLVGRARTLETPSGTLFLDGPRANVSLIGGALYHLALYTVVGDAAAAQPRVFADDDGLSWGHIVHARAASDTEATDWLCPPRPLTVRHLERLFAPLRAAVGAARRQLKAEVVRELARFHHRFVHLHPFRCANQCIAMSLVNHVLHVSHGAGMPHLILDHVGLRLSIEAYERVFAGAVSTWLLSSADRLARARRLADQKARMFEFIERVAHAGSLPKALEVVGADLETARLALFSA